MTSAFSSPPSGDCAWQFPSPIPFWAPRIVVVEVSEIPQDHQASCDCSFDPHETGVVLGRENAVCESPAKGGGQHVPKTRRVTALPLIVTENLLVNVALEVHRRNPDISALKRAFQQAPEILKAISVDLPHHVLVDVVDAGMEVVQAEPAVGRGGVGVHVGVELNVAADGGLESIVVRVGNHHGPDFAAALQQALHNRFTHWAATTDCLASFPLMHVLGLTANECLVDLYITRQLPESAGFHGQPNAVKHEPRSLLGYLQTPGQLAAADSILGVGNAPHRYKPFVEAQRRILEYGPNLNAELLATTFNPALEERARTHDAYVLAATLGARDFPVWKLGPEHGLETDLGVGEVADGSQ